MDAAVAFAFAEAAGYLVVGFVAADVLLVGFVEVVTLAAAAGLGHVEEIVFPDDAQFNRHTCRQSLSARFRSEMVTDLRRALCKILSCAGVRTR